MEMQAKKKQKKKKHHKHTDSSLKPVNSISKRAPFSPSQHTPPSGNIPQPDLAGLRVLVALHMLSHCLQLLPDL